MKKQKKKKPKQKHKILTISLITIILISMGAMHVSAISVDYDTPNSAPETDILFATLPYDNFIINTRYDILSDQVSYNYDYPSTSYIHNLNTNTSEFEITEQEGDIIINPDGTITEIFPEGTEHSTSNSMYRKFFYLKRIPNIKEDNAIYFDFNKNSVMPYETEIYLSKDGVTYKQIRAIRIEIFKGMDITDGEYLIAENYGSGSYEATITWKDSSLQPEKFNNLPENANKGDGLEYPYIKFVSSQYDSPIKYFEDLLKNKIIGEYGYNCLTTIFINSTYSMRTSNKYQTPEQSLRWLTLYNNNLSTHKYRTTFNRQTQSMYPIEPNSTLSLRLTANNYFINYQDASKIPSIRFISNDDIEISIKSDIYYTYVEEFIPEDETELVQDVKMDYYSHEIKGDKTKTYNLIPNYTTIANSSVFNTTKSALYIHEIVTRITVYNWNSEAMDIEWTIPYTTNYTHTYIGEWLKQQTGNNYLTFEPEESDNVYIDGSFLGWLADATSNFFDIEIFGAISLGSIIWFCIGVGVLFAVLKIFAGG